jgi:hypothetical protein
VIRYPGGSPEGFDCLHAGRSHANWSFHYPQTADRRRLTALATDRNATQKHVWRAEIVLLSADGFGTNEIMRRTGGQLERKDIPSTNPKSIVGEHRWVGAVSFERSQISVGSGH